MNAKGKLRLVPNRALLDLGFGEIEPRRSAQITSVLVQRLRVSVVSATATFVPSWIDRLARRIPGVGKFVDRLLRDRDAEQRAWATAQIRVDRVVVDGCARAPLACDGLVGAEGREISVSVTNMGTRPVVVRVVVEGTIE